MKKTYFLLIISIVSLNGLAQKCNHASEVKSLFNQLEANGFNTKQPIAYDYYFVDNDQQKLANFKNTLNSQGYTFVSLVKNKAKYELKVEKIESHTAQSAIKRGEELSQLAKSQGIETFDGFEIKIKEEANSSDNFAEEVEKMNPNDLFKKATQLYDNHQDAEAMVVFDRCIKLNINSAESYYKRANTKTALGRKTEAISDLENAIRLKPTYFEANYNLAGLYFEEENYEKAIAFYQKATSLNPHHDNAFYRLAAAQQQIGLKNAALQNCQKALQINPNNQFAKELLATLK